MKTKGKAAIFCLLFAATVFFSAPVYAKEQTNEALLQERAAVCYVDGTVFEGLVLGAQGAIEFVYLDTKLSNAMGKAHSDLAEAKVASYPFPEWIEEGGYFFAKEGKRGQAVFIARLESFKPWDVDPTLIFVGNYRLTKNDILTPSMTNPFGDIPSGTAAHFVFTVPKSEVRPGAEINLGYGGYGVKWRVPK